MSRARVLSKTAIKEAKPDPKRSRRRIWDARKQGLCVEITRTGAKSFYWIRNGAGGQYRIRLGSVTDLELDDARVMAGRGNEALAKRKDPRGLIFEKPEEGALTVKEAIQLHLDEAGLARRSRQNREWQLARHVEPILGSKPLSEVTRADVAHVLSIAAKKRVEDGRAVGGPVAANRVRAQLSALFSFAIEHGHVDINPVVGTRPRRERGRERYLTPDETKRLLEALHVAPDEVGDAVRLLLFTGQRVGDVLALKPRELDLEGVLPTWRIPATRFKGRREHRVPLIPQAVEVLRERDSFRRNSLRPWWERVLEKARIRDMHVHDLRRTVGMALGATGADHAIIVHVLGHSPSLLGVTARYSAPSLERQAAALQRAVAYLMGELEAADVVPLAGGAG